jgi:hypothetical protein
MSKLDRRKFLLGAGGIALALPFLESWRPKAHQAIAAGGNGDGPKRIIVMSYAMGLVSSHWNPRADFSLPYITEPLEALKHKCVFVSGMVNEVLNLGGNSFRYGHPAKKECALTGTLTVDAFPSSNSNSANEVIDGSTATNGAGANAESIENFVGRQIRNGHPRQSVNLGVHSRDQYQNSDYSSNFFFEGRATPVTMQHNPKVAFDELFAGVTGGEPSPEMLALQARRQSVLDAVQDNFNHVRSHVSRSDRERLDAHASHIRELELAVQTPVVSCSPPAGYEQMGSFEQLYGDAPSMSEMAPLQIRLLANAMACGLAPIGRLEFLESHDPTFGIPMIDDAKQGDYNWHAMVHGDVNPSTGMPARAPGNDPAGYYAPELLAGYRFHVQQFADLLAQLDGLPDGEGLSMLDTSLVILASDLGNGDGHAAFSNSYILAGNTRGGALGQHIETALPEYGQSQYNPNHLFNSVADIFSLDNGNGGPAEFGLRGFESGRIPGLCG